MTTPLAREIRVRDAYEDKGLAGILELLLADFDLEARSYDDGHGVGYDDGHGDGYATGAA